MDKPVALLQVNEPALLAWWATTQSSSSSPSPLQSSAETLLSNPEAEAWVLAQLNAEGLKQGLGRNCVLGAVRLLMDPWTPANGNCVHTALRLPCVFSFITSLLALSCICSYGSTCRAVCICLLHVVEYILLCSFKESLFTMIVLVYLFHILII
jgi:hypothetical protein